MLRPTIRWPKALRGCEQGAAEDLVDDIVGELSGHEILRRVPKWRRFGSNDHVACALTPYIVEVIRTLEKRWRYSLRPLCRAILKSRYPYGWVADNIATPVADRLVAAARKQKEKKNEISEEVVVTVPSSP